jgi:hypothetical protein
MILAGLGGGREDHDAAAGDDRRETTCAAREPLLEGRREGPGSPDEGPLLDASTAAERVVIGDVERVHSRHVGITVEQREGVGTLALHRKTGKGCGRGPGARGQSHADREHVDERPGARRSVELTSEHVYLADAIRRSENLRATGRSEGDPVDASRATGAVARDPEPGPVGARRPTDVVAVERSVQLGGGVDGEGPIDAGDDAGDRGGRGRSDGRRSGDGAVPGKNQVLSVGGERESAFGAGRPRERQWRHGALCRGR